MAKKRVLLVDNEQDINSILCSVLRDNGFEVYPLNDPLLVSELAEYEEYRKEASPKLGERHFVAKPVSNDELIRRINEMLANNLKK